MSTHVRNKATYTVVLAVPLLTFYYVYFNWNWCNLKMHNHQRNFIFIKKTQQYWEKAKAASIMQLYIYLWWYLYMKSTLILFYILCKKRLIFYETSWYVHVYNYWYYNTWWIFRTLMIVSLDQSRLGLTQFSMKKGKDAVLFLFLFLDCC